MYSSKLAVALMIDNKVLREFGDSVYLPFGSEYSILVKNVNSMKASVKIEIDGKDATEGVSLVVDPNESIELERFIRSGNLKKGNRFKFIERTEQIEAHRGTSINDGLIRVEYQFEEKDDPWLKKSLQYPSGVRGGFGGSGGRLGGSIVGACYTAQVAGITAPGSVSDQKFDTVQEFKLSPTKHTIVLKLVGQQDGRAVSSTVTTRVKSQCSSCGHLSKSSAKFCSQCGTSLQLI